MDDTSQIECVNTDDNQSVPCPTPEPVCGPATEGPIELVQEPEKPEVLKVDGPIVNTTPESCVQFGAGYNQTKLNDQVTQTGPGFKVQLGFCNPGSFDASAEGSLGKLTSKIGNHTIDAEGPSARAGLVVNPGGESRVGAQINALSSSHQYDGANGTYRHGFSVGSGVEFRGHSGATVGFGADLGPASFDHKERLPLR